MDCAELSSDSTTLQFMRSTYSGAEGLAATTLASIGLSGGSAMFTLTGAEGAFADTAAAAGATAAAAGASSAADSPAKAVLPAKRQVEESSSSSSAAADDAAADDAAAAHATQPPPLLHVVPAAAVVRAVTHPEPYAGSDAPHADEFMKPAPRTARSTSNSSATSAAATVAGADVMDVDTDDAASSVTSGGGGDFDRYSTVSVAGSDASAMLARMQDVDAMAVVDSANSNYNSSSSSSGAAAMEADEQQQQQLDSSAMGLEVCEAALETLKSSHFDADVLDCVLTLLKYVDGVAQRPGDARTRSIKLSNAAYKKKVSTALCAYSTESAAIRTVPVTLQAALRR
jgi:PUB domain